MVAETRFILFTPANNSAGIDGLPCSRVSSSPGLFLFTMTAIPSMATT